MRTMMVGVLTVAVLTGMLTGCIGPQSTPPESSLPASTYEQLRSAASQLDGVTAVAGTAADVTVTLDPKTAAGRLRTTAEGLHSLVNEHRYPDGAPEVRVEAGRFTGAVGHTVHGAAPGVPQPGPLNLEQLPFLITLPQVVSGRFDRGLTVDLTLEPGTELRSWLAAAAAQQRSLRLSVSRAASESETSRAQHAQKSSGHQAQNGPPVITATVDMTEAGIGQAITEFYDTVEKTDALPVTVRWESGQTGPDATLAVERDDTIAQVLTTFTTAYGAPALTRVSVVSAQGLRLTCGEGNADPEAFFAARDLLAERGMRVESIDVRRTALTVRTPGSGQLRAFGDAVSSPEWPLPGDTRITVHGTANPAEISTFRAAAWPQHTDLLAALWDAGFTAVQTSESAGRTGADFTLGLHPSESQDLVSPASQDALIAVLRDTGWDGRALISLDTAGHPVFTATERGRAEGAYMSLHGVDRKPAGWAKQFLDRFDATAG